MNKLKKGKIYLVRITDKNLKQYYNKTATVKFTGILFRSTKTRNTLFADQCQVIKELKENELD
jgi:hypothetical protein